MHTTKDGALHHTDDQGGTNTAINFRVSSKLLCIKTWENDRSCFICLTPDEVAQLQVFLKQNFGG